MYSRSPIFVAFAGLSLLSLTLVSSLTSAQTPPPAGPRQGFGRGLGGGAFGGGLGQAGGFQGAGEPPVMTVDGEFVYVLRRGILYKVDKKGMKLVGQLSLGPGGPGGRPGGGFGGGGLGGGGNGQP